MSNFPDFAEYGYQVIRELGHNRPGGRVTYLATGTGNGEQASRNHGDGATADPESPTPEFPQWVAIKEFQFASTSGADWAGYEAYQREIQVLQGLNHPGIPRYLHSFQSPGGFCMVQEYKEAESLAIARQWTAVQVKQIAIALLEILAYLQNRIPAVIHRDIKPENILVDAQMNVYLVDFGFAHIGEGEVAMSSIVKGTLGFMPPEQLFNRELTPASDLYGVGATLICLLTKTQSIDIGNLIDPSYQIHFQHLVPKLSQEWIQWLTKMVQPKPKDRFSDAATALEALKPIEARSIPKVVSSHQLVQLTATKLGDRLTQTITIKNPVRGTMLTGRWGVARHPSDRRGKTVGHPWISITPARFKGNKVQCNITVDTQDLMAAQTYERELLLQTNSAQKLYRLALKVHTAPEPVEVIKLPYSLLGALFALALVTVWTLPVNLVADALNWVGNSTIGGLALVWLFLWGIIASVKLIADRSQSAGTGSVAGGVAGSVTGAVTALALGMGAFNGFHASQEGAIVGGLLGLIVGAYAGGGTEILTLRLSGTVSTDPAKKFAGAVAGAISGTLPFVVSAKFITGTLAYLVWLIVGICTGIAAGGVVDEVETLNCTRAIEFPRFGKPLLRSGSAISTYFALVLSLLTTAVGISLGIGFQVGVLNVFVLLALPISGISLGTMIYPHWQQSRLAAEYRRSKFKRIKP